MLGVNVVVWRALALMMIVSCGIAEADDWTHWRGPMQTGAHPTAKPPTNWSEDQHVRWKTPLPGVGHGTPVVWRDRIYLVTAIPVGPELDPVYSQAEGAHDNAPVTHRQQFVVMAFDRTNGAELWRKVVREALPLEQGHFTGSLASASPTTDGERIYASFGSHGLYCLSDTGEVLWEHDLGTMQSKHGHGEGSSPLLVGDLLIINWDHEGKSFIVAFDKLSGKTRWRKERQEVTSWSSPIAVEHDGKWQVIVSGSDRVRSYAAATGDVLWECGGLSHNIVASPVHANGIVVVGSSYEKRAMMAIQLKGAAGDLTDGPNIIWTRDRATPYVPSPLLYDSTIYFLRHYQGVLTRVRVDSGEELPGPLRLGPIGDVYASPVGADGRVYITDLDGTTVVISHEDVPRLIAVNKLDDSFAASAIPVDNELILRGRRFLYCLSEQKVDGN